MGADAPVSSLRDSARASASFGPFVPRRSGAGCRAVVSLDRIAVSSEGVVLCPLRDGRVNVAFCLTCQRLERTSGETPPAYIVCDGREVVGWLGMDTAD